MCLFKPAKTRCFRHCPPQSALRDHLLDRRVLANFRVVDLFEIYPGTSACRALYVRVVFKAQLAPRANRAKSITFLEFEPIDAS